MADSIRIDGLDDAIAALRELPRRLRLAAYRKALRAAGNVIKADARRRAPVLGGVAKGRAASRGVVRSRIPGLVRDSITVKASRIARKRGDVGVYVTVRRLSKAQITAGKAAGFAAGRNPRDPFYFRFLEQGTKKMRARQFLTPAFNDRAADATEAFSSEMRRVIVVEANRR